jgi:hypothetical protein
MAEVESAGMTPRDAARYICMSEFWLRKSRVRGSRIRGAPPFYRAGRAVRYRKTDLDRWLEERREYPGADE